MLLERPPPLLPRRHFAWNVAKGAAAFGALVAFLTSVGVLLTPLLHRGLHKLHLEADERAGQ